MKGFRNPFRFTRLELLGNDVCASVPHPELSSTLWLHCCRAGVIARGLGLLSSLTSGRMVVCFGFGFGFDDLHDLR